MISICPSFEEQFNSKQRWTNEWNWIHTAQDDKSPPAMPFDRFYVDPGCAFTSGS